jgi:hypothetical protein
MIGRNRVFLQRFKVTQDTLGKQQPSPGSSMELTKGDDVAAISS